MENTQELIDSFDINRINQISEQYGELFDWFNQEYPESVIRLDVENNKIVGILQYKLTVLTGKEMSSNQGHFVNTITVDRRRFEDPVWMQRFIDSIVPRYKKVISEAVNAHYQKERDTVAKTFSF